MGRISISVFASVAIAFSFMESGEFQSLEYSWKVWRNFNKIVKLENSDIPFPLGI